MLLSAINHHQFNHQILVYKLSQNIENCPCFAKKTSQRLEGGIGKV